MKRQALELSWPAGGVDRRMAFQNQRPYTCVDALNVFGDDPEFERERGGTRPGATVAWTGLSGKVLDINSCGYYDDGLKRDIFAVAGGNLYRSVEGTGGMESVYTDLADDNFASTVELNGKLYIAGGKDDDRTPIVFDPATGEASELEASAGTVPTNCRLAARFRGRLALSGNDEQPANVFFSKTNDPTDWNNEAFEITGATTLQTAFSGVMAEPVVMMAEHTDACMVLGGQGSIWILRGDPRSGSVERLASDVGIMGSHAWCYDPQGKFWCMTQEGLFLMHASCGGPLESVSREKLPQELRNIDPDEFRVSMCYDIQLRKLLVFVSKYDEAGGLPEGSQLETAHFAIDIRTTQGADVTNRYTAAFWPITAPDDDDPFACSNRKGVVKGDPGALFGTRTGSIYRFNSSLQKDESTNFASHIVLGPLQLGDSFHDGALLELGAMLAWDSFDCYVDVFVGETVEHAWRKVQEDDRDYRYTLRQGFNRTWYPRLRGKAVYLRLAHKTQKRWMIESIRGVREILGRQRKRFGHTTPNNPGGGPTPVP